MMILLRSHVNKLSIGVVSSADILLNEDVLGFDKTKRQVAHWRIRIGAIRSNAVRSASQQDRMSLRVVPGRINSSEKLHAIAHGNPILVLFVVRLEVLLFFQ